MRPNKILTMVPIIELLKLSLGGLLGSCEGNKDSNKMHFLILDI